jgi:hypothetical protein
MSPSKHLEMAGALLAKARSTEFSAERQAFATGAFELFGAFLGRRGSADESEVDLLTRAGSAYCPAALPGALVDVSI